MADNNKDVREQIWRAADPTGENRALINAVLHGSEDVPTWLRRIGYEIDETWANTLRVSSEYRRSIEQIAAAMRVLVPRGWAVTNMNVDPVARAVALVEAGHGDEADNLLAGQWEGDGIWRLERVCKRVRVMGATDPE